MSFFVHIIKNQYIFIRPLIVMVIKANFLVKFEQVLTNQAVYQYNETLLRRGKTVIFYTRGKKYINSKQIRKLNFLIGIQSTVSLLMDKIF